MKASILIVSKNRKAELRKTLQILEEYIEDDHEICVFLDGCKDDSWMLKKVFPRVKWHSSDISLGASKARSILYKTAKGELLFGFDDDAHPLQSNFIELAQEIFKRRTNLGIIAFKEVKGIFESDDAIPKQQLLKKKDFYVNDFLGCGFAIKKDIYDNTRGFPVWIDIYGEEICVALETLELGYDILFTHKIIVNHRVDLKHRKNERRNYFRFGKQLKNTSFFYMVYYPFPLVLKKIARLYFLNFKKYGLKDMSFFMEYFSALWHMLLKMCRVIEYRKPISRRTLNVFNKLSRPYYW